ncbi:MAG TPA: uracil-DNA glycosylase [Candidatus Corynebacterium avicola]|uniref:Uracil-DNA glycosylase n=1 Tax=Candidatus Corynebacterium avicola TaxID=2838527 RepID=A0A9D1RRS0_9CORY|nr:uracil-DNA glycosylase [Candidatus Corynebacterium avicola]
MLATIHPSWRGILTGSIEDQLESAVRRVAQRICDGERIQPAPEHIFRALSRPADDTRVLVLGQDPYPTPGHAVGLSFSSAPQTRPLPKSLKNIFTEYGEDLGLPVPESADLTPWTENGVMLLNRVLTVQEGQAGSDRGQGWEAVTGAVVDHLSTRPVAAILWGRQAQEVADVIGRDRCVLSPHPSPLSAYRGFFGSRPFSRVNQILQAQGVAPVDWSLTGQESGTESGQKTEQLREEGDAC